MLKVSRKKTSFGGNRQLKVDYIHLVVLIFVSISVSTSSLVTKTTAITSLVNASLVPRQSYAADYSSPNSFSPHQAQQEAKNHTKNVRRRPPRSRLVYSTSSPALLADIKAQQQHQHRTRRQEALLASDGLGALGNLLVVSAGGGNNSTGGSSGNNNNNNSNNNTTNNEGNSGGYGSCSLQLVSRRLSDAPLPQGTEVVERALACSRVSNYSQVIKSIHENEEEGKLTSIQQIEITDSESLDVLGAIDLICNQFDCSKLTVFNVTSHRIYDYRAFKSKISSWPKLEILDLSNCSLTRIESILLAQDIVLPKPAKFLHNLKSLILNNNNIVGLNLNYLIERMPNLRHLSLVNNSIFNISCSDHLRHKIDSQFDTIGLLGNAINCDKSQLWFMRLFQDPKINHKFPDYDKINCSAPERLNEMTWSQRVSVLETPICDGCECKSMKRTAISVDCHNKNLTVLPPILPLNTKILNMTSNRIDSLCVPQNSKNWENVTYVYLENNLISSFQPLEINSKFMRNLAALDIRRNKFQEFPSHIFEQFINLDQVHLSNNPWSCDCEPTFAFQEWLQRQFHKVGDKEEIMCGISGSDENGVRSYGLQQRLSSRVIYRLSKSELCPQDNLKEPYDWLDVVNFVLSIAIVLIVSKVALDYIYQHRTKRLPHFFRLNF